MPSTSSVAVSKVLKSLLEKDLGVDSILICENEIILKNSMIVNKSILFIIIIFYSMFWLLVDYLSQGFEEEALFCYRDE